MLTNTVKITMKNWRKLVRYPETFSQREQEFLNNATERLLKVLLGKEKPRSMREKSIFVNCTKSMPVSEEEKAFAKFVIQLCPEGKAAAQKLDNRKIDYDRVACGSGHGNKATRLQEQRKDRWGKDY